MVKSIQNLLPMYTDEGGDKSWPNESLWNKFIKQMEPKSKTEIIQEGYEKDFGKVDRPLGTLADKISDFWGGSPEADARARYLDTMEHLHRQGGSRGGTESGQFIMNQMDIKHRKGQEDKIKKEEEIKKKIAEAKQKAEEEAAFLDSPKGRLQTWWADADKRDAILGGITDAMTEVKFGEDAYQSRLYDTQKNIRQNLRVAEATKLARQKAQLDMYKVAAETSVLANPAQYLTTAQKNAMDIVTKAGLKPGTPEWNQEYSRQLKQIVVKDLTSAKANAIEPLYTFAQVLLNGTEQEKITGQAMLDAIESIVGYLGGTDTGGSQSRNVIKVTDTETETTTGP
jgi:hypothetical protein